MPNLYLRVYDTAEGRAKDVLLPDPSCFWMSALPGACAIHVLLAEEDNGAKLRAEIETDDEEPIQVALGRDVRGGLTISSGARRVFVLPARDQYEPPEPIQPAKYTGKLDVAFLVDLTALALSGRNPDSAPWPLPEWQALAGALVQMHEGLTQHYPEIRTAVIGFGDHSLDFIARAGDLKCALLQPRDPQERRLQALRPPAVQASLLRLRPSSGGDYVDALAEGLRECDGLRWRTDARKMVMLLGDSPGFSLERPAPPNADIQARRLDVDHKAVRLHQHGVELLTICKAAPAGEGDELGDHTRKQYRRLASWPGLAFTGDGFDAEAMLGAVLQPPPAVVRGSGYGALCPAP